MPKAKVAEMKFEESLGRLDEIVRQLERGEVSLDEALTLFEEGTKLLKQAGKQLDAAEQKVLRLGKGADGAPVESLFEAVE